MTYEQLQGIVYDYVDEQKQANPAYTPSVEELTGMIKKIGMQKMIDTDYVDDLPEFDGENLPLGATIEEYFEDLIAPMDYSDQRDFSNHYPSFRKPTYNYPLGRKKFPTTRPLYAYQEACLNGETFSNLTALTYKRLNDSHRSFRYATKVQLLRNWASKVVTEIGAASTFATGTAYSEGDFIKDTTTGTIAIVLKAIAGSNAKTFATLLAEGTITPCKALEEVDAITDTTSGEAFVKAVKVAVEKSQVPLNSENNLSGAQLGKIPSLMLIIKEGVMPTIEVDVLAGAFHTDKVALPAKIKIVKELGEGIVAMLIDPRGCKLHSAWENVLSETHADNANVDTVLHTVNTGFISPNAFVHVFKEAGE